MSETLLKLVGAKIRSARKAKGLSQEQLGEQAGFHLTYIGGVERGTRNISLANLERIAVALEMKAHELLQYHQEFGDLRNRNDALKEVIDLLANREDSEVRMATRILNEIFLEYSQKQK
ncbi:hypothetical protein PAECIP111893_01305 [Paenibacillus plantiphilus]|uniref:HTH cro/C1-type domain-containing protein n=1 Tax=Paenibacillus plantiphilus TaxID=2905650 RepID=A0ABN8G4G1_9BACL|nr:helix-turn-helix transcriptional regulator [Paenibacillus plantiphilus]CAH1199307.1 hypothetical protein PAECIP111893_01305 [Paenibacillus plantiphilus]